MFHSTAIRQRARLVLVACALVVTTTSGLSAQPPNLYVDVADVSGLKGQLVTVPVTVQTVTDSLDGFEMLVVLNRNDLMYFEVDTVVVNDDTMWVCEVDTHATLCSGWEHIAARSTMGKGLDLILSGVSAWPGSNIPGIPDYTSGVLLNFFVRIKETVPDTLTDRVAVLDLSEYASRYSNPLGQLILPVENLDGSVTVNNGIRGDVNCDGVINPADVVLMVNYVYKGWEVLCDVNLGDANCDSYVTPTDVVVVANHVYKGWPMPC